MASLRSNKVVFPDGIRPAIIHHDGGVIQGVSEGAADDDYGDLVVMPGLVDSHVHVNEPGRTEWEGFATATRAAAAGGATTIVDMPLNSIPPTTTLPGLVAKRVAAIDQLSVDVAFWGGLIPGSEPELADLVDAGVSGFKSFLVESGVEEFPPMAVEALEAVLPELTALEVPLLVHAEDPARLLPPSGDPRTYATYLDSRPPSSEAAAVEMIAGMVVKTGARIHVLHVSSADAVAVIAAGPQKLTGETCPHYLLFCAEEIPSGATAFKCAPPIREANHREALWEGLIGGSLAMVVSDHSPAPADMKAANSGNFADAWGGIGSMQLRLSATWTGASARGIGLESLATWLAEEPAGLAGLDSHKGSIEIGKDADFVVFDPDGAVEIRGRDLEHRHPVTPYEGMTLKGTVVSTILRGQTVYENGVVCPKRGRMLKRDD